MGNDIGKYVKLRTVVGYFLDQWDKSSGDFDKCWLLALRGLVDIGFNVSFEPKSVRLHLNGNMTVNLPGDYISWTKIGVLSSNGEVSTLKINKSLSNIKDSNPNRLSYLTADIGYNLINDLLALPYFVNFFGNGYYQPLFGLPAGLIQYGQCTVDETNNLIVMSPNYPFQDVILEYISSPERDDDYMIETVCQEAVIAFIEWKMKLGTDQNYYARLLDARRRLDPVRLQVINQALRENQKYAVKA